MRFGVETSPTIGGGPWSRWAGIVSAIHGDDPPRVSHVQRFDAPWRWLARARCRRWARRQIAAEERHARRVERSTSLREYEEFDA